MITPILKLTGDPELAFSAAFARAIEQKAAPVTSAEVLAAERSLISDRFGGSRSAYLRTIAQAHTNLAVARSIIGDELRRARIASRLPASSPTAAQIADYRSSYGDLQARLVQTSEQTPWLGGRRVGYAIEATAPGALMEIPTKQWSSVSVAAGRGAGAPARPAAAPRRRPLGTARPSIRAVLMAQARQARFPTWLAAQQRSAFPQATCWRDQFPQVGEVDLSDYLTFLQL